MCSSKSIEKSYTLLENIDAVDMSSNGSNTWICSSTKALVRLNPEKEREVLYLELESGEEPPKCHRVEADYNGDFFLIDSEGKLYRLSSSRTDTFKLEAVSHNSKVKDIGCNAYGLTFFVDETNTFFLVNKDLSTLKLFDSEAIIERLDVGIDNEANPTIVAVSTEGNLLQYSIPYSALTIEPADFFSYSTPKLFSIPATDVAVGSDNRIYVATTQFGSFVYNDLYERGIGREFDHIASFGEKIAAGYELYIVSKNKRILKTTLAQKDYEDPDYPVPLYKYKGKNHPGWYYSSGTSEVGVSKLDEETSHLVLKGQTFIHATSSFGRKPVYFYKIDDTDKGIWTMTPESEFGGPCITGQYAPNRVSTQQLGPDILTTSYRCYGVIGYLWISNNDLSDTLPIHKYTKEGYMRLEDDLSIVGAKNIGDIGKDNWTYKGVLGFYRRPDTESAYYLRELRRLEGRSNLLTPLYQYQSPGVKYDWTSNPNEYGVVNYIGLTMEKTGSSLSENYHSLLIHSTNGDGRQPIYKFTTKNKQNLLAMDTSAIQAKYSGEIGVNKETALGEVGYLYDTNSTPKDGVPIYQVYKNNVYFYTIHYEDYGFNKYVKGQVSSTKHRMQGILGYYKPEDRLIFPTKDEYEEVLDSVVPLYTYLKDSEAKSDFFMTIDSSEIGVTAPGQKAKDYTSIGEFFIHISPRNKQGRKPVYRYIHSETKKHFYTMSPNEIDTAYPAADGKHGYSFERIEGYLYDKDKKPAGSRPIHRYRNTIKHFHAYSLETETWGEQTKESEVPSHGFLYEGVLGYYIPRKRPASEKELKAILNRPVPLFRYWAYNDGRGGRNNYYTTDTEKIKAWKYGQKGAGDYRRYISLKNLYVHLTPLDGRIPLYRFYNSNINDDFYTTNPEEIGGKLYEDQPGTTQPDYVFKEITGYVYNSAIDKDYRGVYRYYGPNDHAYTKDIHEFGEETSSKSSLYSAYSNKEVIKGYMIENNGKPAFYYKLYGDEYTTDSVQEKTLSENYIDQAYEVPVPLYRYYNKTSDSHHYTKDWKELQIQTVGETANGFTLEAHMYVHVNSRNGRSPLYRYFNGSYQYYTLKPEEIGTAKKNQKGKGGYYLERIEGFLYPKDPLGGVAVHRFTKPNGSKFLTDNENEVKSLKSTTEFKYDYIVGWYKLGEQ